MHAGGPKKQSSDMAMCGVYYAIVTQNKDEDEKLGRVKVRFPWMPGGDQDQSHWAHLSVPMSGSEFGTWTLPEIEDTVLVVFIAGDIRHPVVIGGMWNSTDTPPEVNENGNNDFRFIKSRAGHRLLFDDSSNTKIVLTDGKNKNYVGIGKFDKGGDGPNAMAIEAPDAINGSPSKGVCIVSAEGTVNLWAPNGKITIKSKDVEFTSSDKTEIKAGGDMTLEGGMAGKVSASGDAKFEGSKAKLN